MSQGCLYVVSTPIGNLDDMSARARKILGSVDGILAEDTRRTGILLRHLGVHTPMVSFHQHNERGREDEVVRRLEGGASLALVSDAGTPLISDPGEGLVARVRAAGFPVVPVPGPSAVLAALVGSGFPAIPFTFLGFFPRKGRERTEALARIAGATETLVLFETAVRLPRFLEDLQAEGEGKRGIAMARELTKLHEEIWTGSVEGLLADLPERTLRGEVTVVIAPRSHQDTDVAEGAETTGDVAVDALARALLGQGERPAQVARDVAQRLNLPRNLVYARVMALAQEEGSA
jgi:16S rRNA (cytidine1402-2'-O)-methyltransferase